MNETQTLLPALTDSERAANSDSLFPEGKRSDSAELIAAQRTALQQERYAFELNQQVEHRLFGRGKIVGMRYANGELLWAVQFEKISARIPTRALQALPKETKQ